MGLFSLLKNKNKKNLQNAEGTEPDTSEAPNAADLNQQTADAIKAYVENQDLGLTDVSIAFDDATGKATLAGHAPSRQAAEAAAAAAGTIAIVTAVDNQLVYDDA